MRTLHFLLLVAGAVVAPTSLSAQDADELLRRSLAAHPTLDAIHLRVASAEAKAVAAEAWPPPAIGIQSSMLPPGKPLPFATGETMLMAEQEIPLGDQRQAMASAERAMTLVYRADSAALVLRLLEGINRELIDIWAARELIALARENRGLLQALYEDIEGRIRVGQASTARLYEIAAEIARLDSEIEAMQVTIAESTESLELLTGQELESSSLIYDPRNGALPPFEALARALNTSPELEEMELMARSREAMADAEEAMLAPMLMLRGGVSWMPQGHPVRMLEFGEMVAVAHDGTTPGGSRFGLMAGAMVSIPLAGWSEGGPTARAEAERLQANADRSERDDMYRRMAAELRSAYGMAERAVIMIEYFRSRQIPLLQQQVDVLKAEMRVDRAALADLIDTWRMLNMAREEVIMMKAEWADAVAMIEGMVGPIELN